MKILIAGSRTIPDYISLRWLETLNLTKEDIIIHGGAVGVDSAAHSYAAAWGIPEQVFLPDWAAHGKKAGMLRNAVMVDEADAVHVLWDGKSPGTKNTIQNAIKKNKDLMVKIYKQEAV